MECQSCRHCACGCPNAMVQQQPQYWLAKNIYLVTIVNMDFPSNSIRQKWLAGFIPYLTGLIIFHCGPNCTLVLITLVVALTNEATLHNQ